MIMPNKRILYLIISINIFVYILTCVYSSSILIINNNILIDWGALIYNLNIEQQLWRLIVYQFLHADILHLILNMSILYMIGISLLRYISQRIFIIIYILSGIIASICSILFSSHLITVGASGSILGIFGFYYFLLYNYKRKNNGNKQLTTKLLIVNLSISFLLIYGFIIGQTNNAIHIGGLLSGIIIGFFYKKELFNSI